MLIPKRIAVRCHFDSKPDLTTPVCYPKVDTLNSNGGIVRRERSAPCSAIRTMNGDYYMTDTIAVGVGITLGSSLVEFNGGDMYGFVDGPRRATIRKDDIIPVKLLEAVA